MADTKISELVAVAVPAATDELAVNQGGVSKRETLAQIKSFLGHAPMLVVAANDSSADVKAAADYVCDGTADDVEIQAAINAAHTRGHDIILAPGRYDVVGTPTITENKRITIWGAGALIAVPAGGTGLKIAQGSTGGNRRGVYVYGLRIDGLGNADAIGVNFTDTNWAALFGVQIENIGRGILMHCEAANEFVEGITLEDIVIRNCSVYGIEARRTGGTNSFGQHAWRNVNINVPVGGIGLYIPTLCSFYRSRMEVGVWIVSSCTAISLDGDFDNTVMDLFVEGATGSSGNTAIVIGANATNLDKALIHYSPWGTIATGIDNPNNKLFMYQQGRRFIGVGGAAPIQAWAHGSSGASVTLEHGGPAGGRITLGSATGAVQDVNLFRSNVNILATNDKFDPEDLSLPTKAGAPLDADVIGGAADGDTILDTAGKLLYVRLGGVWVPVQTPVLSRGGTVLTPAGAVNVMVWRAPFACTVTNVRGLRSGGTGATVNARRNGADTHLAAALSLTAADTWADGGAVQNTAYAAGDRMEIMVVTVAGAPTQVAIQVELTRP